MSVIIREATTNDLDDLATLLVDFNAVHAIGLPHIYRPVVTDAETADYLRRVLASAQTHQFVADVAGQAVGLLILQRDQVPRTPVHVPRQWVIINVLVVREGYRRRGIGEALMRHAHAWAREQGIETVELMVAEFNTAAIAWYEKLGFTTFERRMAWSPGDGPQDRRVD
jgi:diamine N-acetyltransferase